MSKIEDARDGFVNKSLNKTYTDGRKRTLYFITLPTAVACSIAGIFAGATFFSPDQEKIHTTFAETCEAHVTQALGTHGMGSGKMVSSERGALQGTFERNADGVATCVFMGGKMESGAKVADITVTLPSIKM